MYWPGLLAARCYQHFCSFWKIRNTLNRLPRKDSARHWSTMINNDHMWTLRMEVVRTMSPSSVATTCFKLSLQVRGSFSAVCSVVFCYRYYGLLLDSSMFLCCDAWNRFEIFLWNPWKSLDDLRFLSGLSGTLGDGSVFRAQRQSVLLSCHGCSHWDVDMEIFVKRIRNTNR